ncbi:MAG: DUF2809 domain-containing protein [Syntrophobacterales bacterium]|jgi:hypothetical protein|nr:DUF2809 domain-containing protein [Syntrophobacterales bacterium]
MVKIGVNFKFLFAFTIVLIMEIIIAVFIKNGFVREYMGDVLVVVLIYCFIKTFVRNEFKFLPLYVFIFAVLIEIGQYFNFVGRLGLSDVKMAGIILGTTFDMRDIICYLAGSLGLFLFAFIAGKRQKQ